MRLSRNPAGTSPFHDALCKALRQRRLADAGLADEHRVVLGAAADDLDEAADLAFAPDDRVDHPLAGEGGEVASIFLQRLVGALGVLRCDALSAANGAQGG